MKIGSNLSGVYRFRMPQGHYAFVQTKSKLHRNESSSAAEFVISTHSIVRCAEELSVLSLLSLLLLRLFLLCKICFRKLNGNVLIVLGLHPVKCQVIIVYYFADAVVTVFSSHLDDSVFGG